MATRADGGVGHRGGGRGRVGAGGGKKWGLEGRELGSAVAAPAAADAGARGPMREELRAYRDDVLAHLGGAGNTFVDVRSPAEFSGEVLAPPHLPQEQAQVPGHIPGAANVPWASTARDDGSFKSDEELTALYDGVGVTRGSHVIASCRIGARPRHSCFVLHALLASPQVPNSHGPWPASRTLPASPLAH